MDAVSRLGQGQAPLGLPRRARSDLGRVASVAAAGEPSISRGGRGASRPSSLDPPISPSVARIGSRASSRPTSRDMPPFSPRGGLSPHYRERKPPRLRDDVVSRISDRPSSVPHSPDSLTELLTLHSRPASNESRNNNLGVCIPSSMLQNINSPQGRRARSRDHESLNAQKSPIMQDSNYPSGGQSVGVGNGYRPGSREPQMASAMRPPRAPGSAASILANANGQADLSSNNTCIVGGPLMELRNGNRPSSHPRGAVCSNTPMHRQSSEPPNTLASSLSKNQVPEQEGEITPRPLWMRAAQPPPATTPARPWGRPPSKKTVSCVSLAQDPNSSFRTYMEDGHHVVDPLMHCVNKGKEDSWGFFGVYDGHGGRKEVEYCEAKLHDVILNELRCIPKEKCTPEAVKGALVSSFQKIDSQLAMLGAWASGCTCTVVLTHRLDDQLVLHVANVGDSRAVLVARDCAKRVSVDHRANDPAEAQRIAKDGGVVRNGRVRGQLSVSRSLGDHHLKASGVSCVPDVHTFEIKDDRAIVIASDGLWDALEDCDVHSLLDVFVEQAIAQVGDGSQEVAKYIEDRAAQLLVETAKERGSRDNILALVVFF